MERLDDRLSDIARRVSNRNSQSARRADAAEQLWDIRSALIAVSIFLRDDPDATPKDREVARDADALAAIVGALAAES